MPAPRRRKARAGAVKLVAAAAVTALLVVLGLQVAPDPHGRTGEVQVHWD